MKEKCSVIKLPAINLFCFLLICLAGSSKAQSFQWAQRAGSGNGNEYGASVAVDGAGNIYNTGYILHSSTFGTGSVSSTLTAAGNFGDIYISKYNSSGNLQWAFNVGGNSWDEGKSVVSDNSGNVYVTGYFSGSVDFNPGPGTAMLSADSASDIFVAKYNTFGVYQWAFNLSGNNNYDQGNSITVDLSGNIYITGKFTDTLDFNPGASTATLASAGSWDIFIAKYNSSGIYQWATSAGGPANDEGTSLAVSPAGNVIVTGSFENTAFFNGGSTTVTATGGSYADFFIASYNAPTGNYQWMESFGGTLDDYSRSVDVDGLGNIFITGLFSNAIDLDPGASMAILTTTSSSCGFVAKFNSSGGYNWAFILNGECNSLSVDGSGNISVTGSFAGTVDFDPGASVFALTSIGFYFDLFICRYSSAGSFLWGQRIGTNYASGQGIATDGPGSVFITGYFTLTADFDAGPGTTSLSSSGGWDIFVMKLNPTPNSLKENDSENSLLLSPNPTTGIFNIKRAEAFETSEIKITDVMGRIILFKNIEPGDHSIEVKDQKPGIYFVTLRSDENMITRKIILN